MAISNCVVLYAETETNTLSGNTCIHENTIGYHGSRQFPVAAYLDDLSKQYINWHWHEEFEIGFVTAGCIVLECGNREYLLTPGDIFFVNANILHAMHNNMPSENAAFKCLVFHSSLISENTDSIFYTKYLLPILSADSFRECILSKEHFYHAEILELLHRAWNLMADEPEDFEIQVRSELSSLFCMLIKLQKRMERATLLKTQNYMPEKRVQIMLDYLHTHFNRKITIDDLAKAAAISKTEVLRCFKNIIGVSPIHYLNDYRLQKSEHLLLKSNKSIQEVAEDCGFDDNSYFTKLFRKKYGITPHDYRTQQLKREQ